jgi:ATP-binding cassette subfamily B protein
MNTLPKSLPKFIWHFLRPVKKYFIYLLVLITFASSMVAVDGYISKYFIDTIVSGKLIKDNTIYLILAFIVWWELLNIIWRLIEYCEMKTHPQFRVSIVSSMTDYIINHSHSFFQENFAGSISNKVSEMSRAASTIIELGVYRIFYKLMMILFSTIVLWSANSLFAIIFISWCIAFILINMYFMKYLEHYSNLYSESSSSAFGKLVDIVNNIGNVKIFARRSSEIKLLQQSLEQTKQCDINIYKFEIKTNYVKGLMNTILIGTMTYLLCKLFAEHKITVGDFSLVLLICCAISNETWDLIKEIGKATEEVGICNNSLKLIQTSFDVVDSPNAKKLVVNKGDIEFSHVNFKYHKGEKLFEDLSIKIKHGAKVGLVGYSGSGKTTFASLIIRLFDLDSGCIKIDGHDISKVTQDSLRENITFIPQDPTLFHRSLIENIRYGKVEATDEEVYNAAKLAHAHDFILKTSEKYNSLVGERGLKLSGGQRQRIAIARAILKNAPILILDEATSALDSHTEECIQDSLRELMAGKTTLVIAHRLSTLLSMDRILVFDKGKIVEDGSHQKLLGLKGLYTKLWNSQVSGFIVDEGEEKSDF